VSTPLPALVGTPRRNCSICGTPRGTLINAYLAAGRTPHWIEGQMRSMGEPIKDETIRKHVAGCLNGTVDPSILMRAADGKTDKSVADNADFAAAIRTEANRLLAAGQLRVTAAHGLKAQELLDRREERQADRQLMAELATLLSGSTLAPPEDLIEGEWVDVTPERIEAGA
jgi:hypothetical protein